MRLVLVHGSVRNGAASWSAQQPLADELELVVVDRPGFPPGPPAGRIDFEQHAAWLAARLRPGDHLCGHSYGGVVSLFAAAQTEKLASLTVVEPPAFGIAAGRQAADDFAARLRVLWAEGPRDPRAFLAAFYREVAGREVQLPDPLPADLEQGARMLMIERGPWEARPPLEELAAAPFPKLVVSGGWSPAFDAVCDVLEERLAAQRRVLPGAGHNPQLLGAPFNDVLRAFVHGASN
ncbi:MAG TPA: alpha/beta fold hydrolase [Gaiellaceae bacterium]|nr:alpha/beta fold hydrolase [Gaiellaceae bacterium]